MIIYHRLLCEEEETVNIEKTSVFSVKNLRVLCV